MKKPQTHTSDEAFKSCLDYYRGEILPASVVHKKYLLRNNDGIFVEANPNGMHDRLAKEFTRIEKKMNPGFDEDMYCARVRILLDGFRKTVPQGSPMSAIGNPFQIQSTSNCFVIDPPADNMGGIFQAGFELAQIMKRRGGVGVDLSKLRPTGSKVNNAASKSSGVPCFADFYSYITRMIGQVGRQGALMLTIDVNHPDIFNFIRMKSNLQKVTGANVSIKISDAFMRAVEKDRDFRLQWPVDAKIPQVIQDIKAKDLWKEITEAAWRYAEPGLLMWDNITKTLPAHNYPGYFTSSTNPCSEIALCPYDSCRLISQNLMGWVKNPFTEEAEFDFEQYNLDTMIAQRMSDGLVELEIEAIEKIIGVSDTLEEIALWKKVLTTAKNGRRTGLGTHALADVFLALGIRYDSKEAVAITDQIYNTHKIASYTESMSLARERGPFLIWDWETDQKCRFINNLPGDLLASIKKYGRRNISNLTCAPTGSISILSNTSSGIEPVFRWVYDRRVKITNLDTPLPVDFVDAMGDKWSQFRVVHPAVKMYFEINKLDMPVGSGRDFSMSIDEANRIISEKLPKHFVTSDQVDYSMGVTLQAAAQQHIDHGISKTINLPKGTSVDTVSQVYFEAWRTGLKGVTVYVDGSRDGVLITESQKKEKEDALRPEIIKENHAPKRPKTLPAEIHHAKVKGNDWAVVVGLLDGKPYEVWAGRGLLIPKSNKIESATITKVKSNQYKLFVQVKDGEVEEFDNLKELYDNDEQRVINRSVCRELRHGIPIEFVAKDLAEHTGNIGDFSAALSRVLKKYASRPNYLAKKCPQCGGTEFILVEACPQCVACGNSKCQ